MVFVTGATGLVGSYLVWELLGRNTRVRALCRSAAARERVLALWRRDHPGEVGREALLEWVEGDILDLPFLESAMTGVHTVYHCAGLVSFDPAREEALLKTNWEGTRNMVNTCLGLGVKTLCHVSSISTVAGTTPPLTESDTWDPARTNVYATSKYLAEMEVWRGGQEGLQTVIVNPGVIFGPGFWDTGSNLFFSRTASGMRYYPPGGTGFIGIRDVVACMVGLTTGGHYGQRYILISENLTYKAVIEHIACGLGVAPPKQILRPWQLEILWRLDWLRTRITGRERRLSKRTARGLGQPKAFSAARVEATLGYRFQPVQEVIDNCLKAFKRDRGVRS